MKRFLMVLFFLFAFSLPMKGQEWMTSLDIAKRLALTQGKLLFVIWEDASYDPYPVLIADENGQAVVDDLFTNESITQVIWEYFVPVIIPESKYEALFNEIKGKRSINYIDKFNDDTVKIMDVNGNVIDVTLTYYDYIDIASYIKSYALDTSILRTELENYQEQKDFNTTYRLAAKYIDFSILIQNEKVRSEFITLSNYYLTEAQAFISSQEENEQSEIQQKVLLQNIKQQLVLDKPKKVLRRLKRFEASDLSESNKELFAFLNYTAHLCLKDERKAAAWRNELSLVNLKKANLIINNNR